MSDAVVVVFLEIVTFGKFEFRLFSCFMGNENRRSASKLLTKWKLISTRTRFWCVHNDWKIHFAMFPRVSSSFWFIVFKYFWKNYIKNEKNNKVNFNRSGFNRNKCFEFQFCLYIYNFFYFLLIFYNTNSNVIYF